MKMKPMVVVVVQMWKPWQKNKENMKKYNIDNFKL